MLFPGEYFGLTLFTSVLPGLIHMNSVTAICFILLGTSLLLYSSDRRSKNAERIAVSLGAITFFCGVFSSVSYVTGNGIALDWFLPEVFRSPSKMAINTSLLFILTGICSSLLYNNNKVVVNVVQSLLMFCGFVSLAAFLGYLYRISSFYDIVSVQGPMALNTSVAFTAVSLGFLMVNTSSGFISMLTGNSGSAKFARRLLPIVAIMPLVFGFLRILGELAGLYSYSTGIALFVVAFIASLILLILVNTYLLRKEEIRSESNEKEFIENERKLRAIINNSPSAIYAKDLSGKFTMVNRKIEQINGIAEKDMLGKTLKDVFPGMTEVIERNEASDRKVLETGIPMESEEQVKLEDGIHTFISQKFPLADVNGNVYALCGISTDITERKNATDKFIAILDSAPDAIVIVSDGGYVELVNKQTERIFGYKRDEIIGRKVETLVPDALREIHERHRSNFFLEHSVRPMGSGLELFAKRKNGVLFPVEISLSPMKTSEGVFVSAAIRDITERKKNEQRLKDLNIELVESNNELESFSYSVSHDLRAPLRHIIGFGEKLRRVSSNHLSEEENRLLSRITDSASKMGRLIDDLLMFSRVGRTSLSLSNTNMNSIIDEFLAEQADITGNENIQWKIGDLPPAYADPFQIKLVLQNLLANAVKYTSKSEHRVIEVGSYFENGEIIYYVKDSGCGFDMEYISKLFGVFQRLHGDKEYEGTGIGLATVKRIISRHKGRVWAFSEQGRGAEFYFSLPAAPEGE